MTVHRPPRKLAPGLLAALLALVFLLPALALLPAPAARADTSTSSLTGTITGPSIMGTGLRANFQVTATGGPAVAPNGTVMGVLSFKASLVGLNTSTGSITPPQGVLINGTISLSVVAPNLTESMTLYVELNSTFAASSTTTNLTYVIQVVTPITLAGTLHVVGPASVKNFALTVNLDGRPVGTILVPTLTSGQTFPIQYSYVAQTLSPGWHTFGVSVAQEHGLLAFSNGAEAITIDFYVPGPSPDYTIWILAGSFALIAAVVIWVRLVGARRRPKARA